MSLEVVKVVRIGPLPQHHRSAAWRGNKNDVSSDRYSKSYWNTNYKFCKKNKCRPFNIG